MKITTNKFNRKEIVESGRNRQNTYKYSLPRNATCVICTLNGLINSLFMKCIFQVLQFVLQRFLIEIMKEL